MRTNWISKFLVSVALFLLCGSALSAPIESLNFTLRRGHLIVIPVTVNGSGPFEFMLDTGATTTLVTAELARQLRLRPVDRIELVTVAGSQILVRTELDQVSVGAQTAAGVEVLVSDLREVRGVEPKLCGVLGQNVLARFNFLIDYAAQRLEFETRDELSARLCGERWPLSRQDERWLVTLPVNQKPWRFVPDTGTATLLLFGEHKPDWSLIAPQAQLLRTDLGSRTVSQSRARSLQIGLAQFNNLPVTILAADQARREDGLLPLSLFQRVYINHRHGYLILNPVTAK
ncbi:MAG TPA: aspartyl protease family protein [Blastocatellia bacterium]|nr:aspartyl protease family protein [Blastocatellia bacterium]HMX25451.1 aspartyl protease family protein [Blastocatellia bacterium]HMY75993.1 aspartyl protease family protein [Blastocatellia bacterium]HMZ18431.1 aspartyl protease family protein [Blastocatellia bacterium]HNG32652.1 aspartyl protease family protein [Blastocatellia bacterium]